LTVYDILERRAISKIAEKETITLSLELNVLAGGIYFMEFETPEGKSHSQKIAYVK